MRKVILLSILAFLLFTSFLSNAVAQVQVPRTLNYQANLRGEGNIPINRSVPIIFSIYEQELGGAPLWSEVQDVNVVNGYINVYLGTINELNLTFDKQYWLEITVGNGTPYPRTPLSSVGSSIRSIYSSYTDTAGFAEDIKDGIVTQQKLAPGVKAIPWGPAGGDLEGEYPNPTIKATAVLDKIGPGSITQDKLAKNICLPPCGPASGDLTGSYPDPLIAPGAVKEDRIFDGAVTTNKIRDGAIVNSKIALGAVHNTNISAGNAAVNSVLIVDNNGNVVWGTPIPGGQYDEGDLYGSYLAPLVDGIHGRPILNTAPNNGQAYVWNGNAWTPSNLIGDITGPLTNNWVSSIQGVPVSAPLANDGEIYMYDNGQIVPTLAGGDVTGPYNDLTVVKWRNFPLDDAVLPSTTGEIYMYDALAGEWVIAQADGDVSGLYNNLRVDNLQGVPLNAAGAQGNFLVFNNNMWEPANAAGDVNGGFNTLQVDKIKGRNVSNNAPLVGQNYMWDGAAWTPTTAAGDVTGAYNALRVEKWWNINVEQKTVPQLSTGDLYAFDQTSSMFKIMQAGGDVTGRYNALSVVKLRGFDISPTPPQAGSVYMYNGAAWIPAQADGDVTGFYDNLQIKAGAVGEAEIANGAVTNPKLAPNAVTSDKIMDGEVKNADIANGAVDHNKIGAGEVYEANIATGAVTNTKIGNNAVTSDKILDGEVKNADIANGAVDHNKIGAGEVYEANIATGAVTNTKIGNNAVTSDKILDGEVKNADIANGAVDHNKIGAGEVYEANIANGAVTNSKLGLKSVKAANVDPEAAVKDFALVSDGGGNAIWAKMKLVLPEVIRQEQALNQDGLTIRKDNSGNITNPWTAAIYGLNEDVASSAGVFKNITSTPNLNARPALYAWTNSTHNDGYAFQAERDAGTGQYVAKIADGLNGAGRVLLLDGDAPTAFPYESMNPGGDINDLDEAVLVVRNQAADPKIAIKTYGDIVANSGVYANNIWAYNKVIVGTLGNFIEIKPPAVPGGPLEIDGDVHITGTLEVDQNATFHADAFVDQDLAVGGDVNITGKGYSALTVAADPANTLSTKSYVDASVASISADNGITENPANNFQLGGTLIHNTTIAQGNFDMIWNLNGSGDFKIQDNGTDVFVVNDLGNVNMTGTLNVGTSVTSPIGNLTTVNATTVNATNFNGGTFTGTPALTGGTIAGATITGGTINNTPIGGITPSTGTFTTLNANTGNITTVNATTVTATNFNGGTFTGTPALTNGTIAGATITGGTIDNTVIGGSIPAAGTFTTVNATNVVATNDVSAATFTGGSFTGTNGTFSGDVSITGVGTFALPAGPAVDEIVTVINNNDNTALPTEGAVFTLATSILNEPYVTWQASANLTNENVLTEGNGIDVTLGGGNATVSVEKDATLKFTGTALGIDLAHANTWTALQTFNAPGVAINAGTIDGTVIGGTTPAAGTFTTVNATTVNATNFNGGTFTGTPALTGGTIAGATITGGTINNTPIGGTTPSTGSFTTLNANTGNITTVNATTVIATNFNGGTFTGTPALTGGTINNATITGGTIDNTVIGGTTPAAGTFTTATANAFVGGSFSGTTGTFTGAVSITGAGTFALPAGPAVDEIVTAIDNNDNTALPTEGAVYTLATSILNEPYITWQASANLTNDVVFAPDATLNWSTLTGVLSINTANANHWTATQWFDDVNIDGGVIDNTVIGGTTPAAGTFTDMNTVNNANIGNQLNVTNDAIVGGDLTVVNDADIFNDLSVGNDLDVTNNANVGVDLTVGNDAFIGNDLWVTANTYAGWDLFVNNDAIVGNNLDVANDAFVGNNLDVTNDLNVGNNVVVVGDVSAATFTGGTFIGTPDLTGGTIAGATITGGSIDNTPIGAGTPNTGNFTTVIIGDGTPALDLLVNGDATVTGTLTAGTLLGPVGFNQITTGTNNSATMTVGTGATLTFSGAGVVNANQFNMVAGGTNAVDLATAEVNGILPKANLPASVAYEDESNVFTLLNTFNNGLTVNNAATTLNNGLTVQGGAQITGGIVIPTGGLNVQLGGATIAGGLDITTGNLNVALGSLAIPVGNIVVTTGQLIVDGITMNGGGAGKVVNPVVTNLTPADNLGTLTPKGYVDALADGLRDPEYFVRTASASLNNERVLTFGDGLTYTDGGPGGVSPLVVNAGDGLNFNAGALQVNAGAGITIVGDAVTANDPSPTNELITGFTWEVAGSKTLRITEAATNWDAVLTQVAEYDDAVPTFSNAVYVATPLDPYSRLIPAGEDIDGSLASDVEGNYVDGVTIKNGAVDNSKINDATSFVDVMNGAGVSQFNVTDGNQALRFSGAGITNVAFTPATHTVTITSTEVDPEVQMTNVNAVPRWNGTALVDGLMTDDGTNTITAGGITLNTATNTINATTVNATNFNGGTFTGTPALTGGTIAGATITGGTIDNTVIGGSIPAAGTFTTVNATNFNGGTFTGTPALTNGTIANATITGGTIDNTVIGGTTPAAGTFTTVNATNVVATNDVSAATFTGGSFTGTDGTFSGDVSITGAGTFALPAGPAVDEIVTAIDDNDNTALPTEGAVYTLATSILNEPYITWQASANLTNDVVFAPDATLNWSTLTGVLSINTAHANHWTATQWFDDVNIDGGVIDNTVIGGTTPAAGTFTTVNATTVNATNFNGGTFTGTPALTGGTIAGATITGGTIDNTVIGGTTPAAGTFTTVNATNVVATNDVSAATFTGGSFTGTDGTFSGDVSITGAGTFALPAGPAVDEIVTVIDDNDNTALPTEGAVYTLATSILNEPYITWQASANLTNDVVFAPDATLNWSTLTGVLSINTANANHWTATQWFDDVNIDGGVIDNTVIGGTTPAAGTFTTVNATTVNATNFNGGTFTGTPALTGGTIAGATITGGTIDNTVIGGTTPAAGTFTTVNATQVNTTDVDATGDVSAATFTGGTFTGTAFNGGTGSFTNLTASTDFTLVGSTYTAFDGPGLVNIGNVLQVNAGAGITIVGDAVTANDPSLSNELITATSWTPATRTLSITEASTTWNTILTNIVLDSDNPAAGDITGSYSAGFQVLDDSHNHTGLTVNLPLQESYNDGNAIVTGAAGAVSITQGVGAPATVLSLTGRQVITGIGTVDGLIVTNTGSNAINAQNTTGTAIFAQTSGANTTPTVWIDGSGTSTSSALFASNNSELPTGNAYVAEFLSTRTGIDVLYASGEGGNTINAQNTTGTAIYATTTGINTTPTLYVDGSGTSASSALFASNNSEVPTGNAYVAEFLSTRAGVDVLYASGTGGNTINAQNTIGSAIYATTTGANTIPTVNIDGSNSSSAPALYATNNGDVFESSDYVAEFTTTRAGGGALRLDAEYTETLNRSTALYIESGKVRYAYTTVATRANLANRGQYTVIYYTDTQDLDAQGYFPPDADCVNGQIMIIVNGSGANRNILGTTVANGHAIQVVYANSDWVPLP